MRAAPANTEAPATELGRAIAICRKAFGLVLGFNVATNLLILALPLYMLQVYDRVLGSGRVETLIFLTLMAVTALIVMGVLDGARASVAARIARWLSLTLAPVVLERSIRTRLWGDTAGAQPLRDLQQLQTFLASPGLNAFLDAPWVVLFSLLIMLLHPLLGLVALLAAGSLIGLGVLNERMTRSLIEETAREQIAATREADMAIRNAESAEAMAMSPALIRRWSRSNATAAVAHQSAMERMGAIAAASKALRLIVQVSVLGVGAWLVLQGALSSGSMIAASILLGRALAPVEQSVAAWQGFSTARSAYRRLQGHLERLPPRTAQVRLPAPRGALRVEDLSARIPHGGPLILRRVSFEVAPGEGLAVVGPSGAGKSTLCRYLVGLAEPYAGSVKLDGCDLAKWDFEQLGAAIGFLPQDVELFFGTVRDNIARMGEAPDEAVIAAAQRAMAHELISGLPQGYDTLIGEGGVKLSGGQRQRIGLARALFGEPRLIVLDEPNANLDQEGESALAAAIAEVKRNGAAVVIVGHRPSTLAQADRVMLLKDGAVALIGPREEVLTTLRREKPPAESEGEGQAARHKMPRPTPA